jgi:hypothetical protein
MDTVQGRIKCKIARVKPQGRNQTCFGEGTRNKGHGPVVCSSNTETRALFSIESVQKGCDSLFSRIKHLYVLVPQHMELDGLDCPAPLTHSL